MKVLAIMGSPRKGDSYKAVQDIEQKLKAHGDIEFEYLFLRDADLEMCKGCHACIMKGEDYCPCKDDRAQLEQKLMETDGIILVSPVYSQHVTGLMKNFIDRFTYCWHRPRFFGKKAMALSTGGGQFKETLGYLAMNAKNWGFEYITGVGVPHMDALTPKFRVKIEKQIIDSVEAFYKSLHEKHSHVPGLGRLLWFGIWKGNAIACKDSIPADYAYWTEKGWLDRDYYYNTRVNLINKGLVKIIGKLGGWYMGKIYKDY